MPSIIFYMSLNIKPAIVLVHGAWHVPEHYNLFIRKLQETGFDVFCPQLPTCNKSGRSNASLHSDAETVRSQVISLIEDSRDVVMLLHSYGGAVGTEVARGLSASERASRTLNGGIIGLIYMCAFMLQIGESVGGASLPRPVPDPVELDATTGTTFLCGDTIQLFYADVEPSLAKKMADLLVRQSGLAMTDAISYPAWKDIPSVYFKTELDQVLFLDWQERQIKAVTDAGAVIAVETFKSSHSPFLSIPEEMVAAIERFLESLVIRVPS